MIYGLLVCYTCAEGRPAEIAVKTVLDEIGQTPAIQQVIFDVFKGSDLAVYHRLLQ